MARPTKLTPEIQIKIVKAIQGGNYIETAAAYAGISKNTLYDWLKRGARANSGKYKEFSDAVEKALAESEMRDVLVIGNAAKENWQAAAWRLERKFPSRWGRKDRHEVTGEGGGPVAVADVTDRIEQYEGVYANLAQRSAPSGNHEGDGS